MFEYEAPGGGPSLKAWYSEAAESIRVVSTPGGIAVDVDTARDLRDELDEIIETAEERGA